MKIYKFFIITVLTLSFSFAFAEGLSDQDLKKLLDLYKRYIIERTKVLRIYSNIDGLIKDLNDPSAADQLLRSTEFEGEETSSRLVTPSSLLRKEEARLKEANSRLIEARDNLNQARRSAVTKLGNINRSEANDLINRYLINEIKAVSSRNDSKAYEGLADDLREKGVKVDLGSVRSAPTEEIVSGRSGIIRATELAESAFMKAIEYTKHAREAKSILKGIK